MDLLSAMFLVEAKACLQGIEDELRALETPGSVQKVFRAVHSIKGAAGCLGFFKILSVAQALEGMLSLLRQGCGSPRLCSSLRDGFELLACLIDRAPTSNETNISSALAEFEDLIGAVQTGCFPQPSLGK